MSLWVAKYLFFIYWSVVTCIFEVMQFVNYKWWPSSDLDQSIKQVQNIFSVKLFVKMPILQNCNENVVVIGSLY